jgi:hypothetical protein
MIRLECTGRRTHRRRTLTRFEYAYGAWFGNEQGTIQFIDKETGMPAEQLPPALMPPTALRLHLACPACRRTFTVTDTDAKLQRALDAASEQGMTHVDLSLLL